MEAVPKDCREEGHSAFTRLTHVLNQGVTYVLPRALFDGTLRPQSCAAFSGLPKVVFRAASQWLGFDLRLQIFPSNPFLDSSKVRLSTKKAPPVKGGLFRNLWKNYAETLRR